jgi:hypothetical protein
MATKEDDRLNQLGYINRLIIRNYKPIWRDCDRQKAFELVNHIRDKLLWERMDYATFDKGYQWRNIFSEDYESAKDEFTNVVLGWW